jgi:hypothetical protein
MLSSGFSYGGNGANSPFYVDAEGNLFATSATFDTALTVKATRGGDNVFYVDSSGNIRIAGNGRVYCNTATNSDSTEYIYYDGKQLRVHSDQWVVCEGSNVALSGTQIGVGSTPTTAAESAGLSAGSLRVGGDILYVGNIYCTNKE